MSEMIDCFWREGNLCRRYKVEEEKNLICSSQEHVCKRREDLILIVVGEQISPPLWSGSRIIGFQLRMGI
uniref:Uncharacterized protein n=1 Tax=viral metagenome TaxID=1070528 RepID=A0A6H2A3V3_9ZZZZ